MERLTMYIVLRKDLIKDLGWTTGSMIAQASHASTACLEKYKLLESTQEYLKDIDHMHKVVLQIKDEKGIKKIEDNLIELKLPFYSWIEQPENIMTCIATAPLYKSQLKEALKKCSLYK